MNEINHDKIWELAAAKIHNEADNSDINELGEAVQHNENKKIWHNANDLHQKLTAARLLQHGSETRSWKKIARSIKSIQIRLYLNVAKYAAIVLLAFGVGTLVNYTWKPAGMSAPVFTEIHTPLGQMSEMTLSDGTHIWLNSGTTLRYASDFGNEFRKVELEGEAFFQVKSGNIPFKVKIKNSEVEVLGTSFAAVAYPDEDFCQVTLVEGSVQVNNVTGRKLKNLEPNHQLHIPDNLGEKITTREVNTLFYESWIKGQIKFDEERLADVTRRMERWYNVEIKYASQEAGELRFTGTVLKNKPVDQSIKAISALLPIQVEHKSNLHKKDVITIKIK